MKMKIAVFCGSSFGVKSEYEAIASKLGVAFAKHQFELVYGGSVCGLMGSVADNCLQNGGKVTGVITQHLSKNERAHDNLSELHITDNILQRKELMEKLSDAFVILPGGYGTLDEMFEVLMYGQLGYHQKPTAVLNIDGFFDHFFKFLEHMTNEGFVRQEHFDMLINAHSIDDLIEKVTNYSPPKPKWE